MDLVRRLRYGGYLDVIGIAEREPGEVFEKLVDHLAATHDWSRVKTSTKAVKKATKKTAKKAGEKSSKTRKAKAVLPEPEMIITEPVKLHYLVDRRDFLEKLKTVYAAYAA